MSFVDYHPRMICMSSGVRGQKWHFSWKLQNNLFTLATCDYNETLHSSYMEHSVQPWSYLYIETIFSLPSLLHLLKWPCGPNKCSVFILNTEHLKRDPKGLWLDFISDLLHFLRCCRQQRLSSLHPVPAEVDVLAQSTVLHPAANLLLGPLAEWNTQISEDRDSPFLSRSNCCFCLVKRLYIHQI